MGKGDPCEICGGTESNLVDGFYYCAECGTQDTNVRETLVEHTVLADGTFAIARSQKFSVKIKDGVQMSNEWYKWHTYNFKLAGLAEQLVQLGASRSLKMKVLWIWCRYVKKFQNKDEMRQTQMFSQLEDEWQSEHRSWEPAAEAGQPRGRGAPLRHVSRSLLAALLAVALNLDRGALQLSHFCRLVLHKLLPINDTRRFVPEEIDPHTVEGYALYHRPLTTCWDLPTTMGRVAKQLELGPFLTPDVEAVLAAQLRDLRLPPALGRLALALMDRAPIPYRNRHHLKSIGAYVDRYPDYEAVVLAYVLVALKMCFGLDDDRETRLSEAVDRVNAAEDRPRAYGSVGPAETASRLFSFREWCAHLQFRKHTLCANYAPLAWEWNMRADDHVFAEHFEDFSARDYDGRRNRKSAHAVSDELTMDILHKMPRGGEVHVPPLSELKPCLAQVAPHAALARALVARLPAPAGRRLLDEDFTTYSVDYAFRTFSLPDADAEDLFVGVDESGKTFREDLGDDLVVSRSDPTMVLVRNCENKNWIKTERPTAYHVVKADEDVEDADEDGGPEPGAADDRQHEEVALETFREEIEAKNIFDDDFLDVCIKEEIKVDHAPSDFDETEDNLNLNTDYFGTVDSSFRENVENDRSERSDVDRRGGLSFDSDEEAPRFDPTVFNRQETFRNIMVAAYREYNIKPPVRFATLDHKNYDKKRNRRSAPDRSERPRRPEKGADKRQREETAAAVAGLLAQYTSAVQSHALQRSALLVNSFLDDVDNDQELECNSTAADQGNADAVQVDPSDTRDVQFIENDLNETDDDDFIDGPMEDPVYIGDTKFDEKTHDSRQLYIKLKEVPDDVDVAPDVGGDEDVAKILDEKITSSFPKRVLKKKEKPKKSREKFTQLVNNPERLTKFNYWFKHYKSDSFRKSSISGTLEKEMADMLPRSFRFVLHEGAALLQVPPAVIYRSVIDIEARMLALLATRRRRGNKNQPRPARSKENIPRQAGSPQGSVASKSEKGKKRGRRKAKDSGETLSRREAGTREDSSPSSKRQKGNEILDKDHNMQR